MVLKITVRILSLVSGDDAELANTGGNTDFQGWVSVKFYLSCIKNETFWGSPIENVEPPQVLSV